MGGGPAAAHVHGLLERSAAVGDLHVVGLRDRDLVAVLVTGSHGIGRTNTPSPKITAAGAAGAAAVLIVFIAEQFGLEIPPAASAAIATLLACAAGYFKRDEFSDTDGQRGYSLVEVLAAMFIALLIVIVLLALLDRL